MPPKVTNHQGLDNQIPFPNNPQSGSTEGLIVKSERLGGLLYYYSREERKEEKAAALETNIIRDRFERQRHKRSPMIVLSVSDTLPQ